MEYFFWASGAPSYVYQIEGFEVLHPDIIHSASEFDDLIAFIGSSSWADNGLYWKGTKPNYKLFAVEAASHTCS